MVWHQIPRAHLSLPSAGMQNHWRHGREQHKPAMADEVRKGYFDWQLHKNGSTTETETCLGESALLDGRKPLPAATSGTGRSRSLASCFFCARGDCALTRAGPQFLESETETESGCRKTRDLKGIFMSDVMSDVLWLSAKEFGAMFLFADWCVFRQWDCMTDQHFCSLWSKCAWLCNSRMKPKLPESSSRWKQYSHIQLPEPIEPVRSEVIAQWIGMPRICMIRSVIILLPSLA